MFQFPITLHKGSTSTPFIAPVVTTLNLLSSSSIASVILQNNDGPRLSGLYLFDSFGWRYCLSSLEVSNAVIFGYKLSVYFGLTQNVTAPDGSIVFRNAIKQTGLVMKPDNGFYCVQELTSSLTAGVTSINGLSGGLTVQGSNGLEITNTGNVIDIKPGSLDEGTF